MTDLSEARELLANFQRHDPTSAESSLHAALVLILNHIETDLAIANLEIKERVS